MLRAKGIDWLTGSSIRVIYTTTAFISEELANSRVEKFRQLLINNKKLLSDEEIEIAVISLEVIED